MPRFRGQVDYAGTCCEGYASAAYRAELARQGGIGSMSRKGDCWDNAVAESFFSTIKAGLLDHLPPEALDALRRRVADFIDGFYNIQRRHSKLGYLSPIEFELRYLSQQVPA